MLTSREKDVFGLVCEGYTKNEIAQKLNLSPETVKVHIRNILAKYGLKNTKQLIIYNIKSKVNLDAD